MNTPIDNPDVEKALKNNIICCDCCQKMTPRQLVRHAVLGYVFASGRSAHPRRTIAGSSCGRGLTSTSLCCLWPTVSTLSRATVVAEAERCGRSSLTYSFFAVEVCLLSPSQRQRECRKGCTCCWSTTVSLLCHDRCGSSLMLYELVLKAGHAFCFDWVLSIVTQHLTV